ncbi:hypothetical protein LBJG_01207 [Lactobacillus jensenii 1153]|nr:hypothetical protein LBJG_01207 [Lactobacillus jensenii 1153]
MLNAGFFLYLFSIIISQSFRDYGTLVTVIIIFLLMEAAYCTI